MARRSRKTRLAHDHRAGRTCPRCRYVYYRFPTHSQQVSGREVARVSPGQYRRGKKSKRAYLYQRYDA